MELKVYISGKISGEEPVACKLKFLDMHVRLRSMGVPTVINPFHLGIPETWPWKDAMNLCMDVLKEKANTIVMLNDWTTSNGAKDEYDYARNHDYLIIFEHQVPDLWKLVKREKTWIDTSALEFP